MINQAVNDRISRGPVAARTRNGSRVLLGLAALLLLPVGCSSETPPTGVAPPATRAGDPAPTAASQPAGAFVGLPDATCLDVTADDDGVAHLLFGRPEGGNPKSVALYHTRSGDGGATWTEPVLIPTGHAPPHGHHRGNDPRIAARGDRLMALWTTKGAGPFGSGPPGVALSDDGGRTWRPGPAPAAAPADAGYRFPAVAADGRAFHAVWIHAVGSEGGSGHGKGGGHGKGPAPAAPGRDNQAGGGRAAQLPKAAKATSVPPTEGAKEPNSRAPDYERSLRHARLDFGARRWSGATVIDPRICACCWNDLKAAADGSLYALYRDQEPSDMSLAVSPDGGATWQPAGHVGRFDWHFNGCPHVGGAVAPPPASTTSPGAPAGGLAPVMASVWTGQSKHAGAYVVRSDDVAAPGGEKPSTSAPPVALGTGAQGRGARNTDLARLSATHAVVVWDQPAPGGGGQAIYLRRTSDGGVTWGEPVRVSPADGSATYPRIVACRDRYLVLWTAHDTGGNKGDALPQTHAARVDP